jgi:hypothetical protein
MEGGSLTVPFRPVGSHGTSSPTVPPLAALFCKINYLILNKCSKWNPFESLVFFRSAAMMRERTGCCVWQAGPSAIAVECLYTFSVLFSQNTDWTVEQTRATPPFNFASFTTQDFSLQQNLSMRCLRRRRGGGGGGGGGGARRWRVASSTGCDGNAAVVSAWWQHASVGV